MAKAEHFVYDNYIYIGVGTNLGDKLTNILQAIRLMSEQGITILRAASVYETEPWGFNSDDTFYNTVLECDYSGDALNLLHILKGIEETMGRPKKTGEGYTSRIIDLDILLFKDQQINVKNLIVPHPHLAKRSFVLYPLDELTNPHIFRAVGKSLKLLISDLKDDSKPFIARNAPFINEQKGTKL